MKPAETKEIEALARRVAVEVARCPQRFQGEQIRRCTQPRGHDSRCAYDEQQETAWQYAEEGK